MMTATETTTKSSAFTAGHSFRERLSAWYRERGRHKLPWRLTRDPYAVLISEVMLQQTQVDRVLPYYLAWLERWPGFSALAEASPAEVIRAWRGLGYNRRGLNLHRLAVEVVTNHGGELPRDPAVLRTLPGIGPYTQGAIRAFAREEHVAVADTNIARVVARSMFAAASQHEVRPAELAAGLAGLLPESDARAHNLALMDLGALVCRARTPECGACPVAHLCGWRANGYPPGALAGRPAPKFEETARYARGRIIDALREAPATATELAAMLPARHAAELATYLGALEREGMAELRLDVWSLPTGE